MNNYIFHWIDLWPYFIIVLALFFIPSRFKYVSLSYFVLLLLFSVFRYDVGWDYLPYWEEISDLNLDLSDTRYEPLSKVVIFCSVLLKFIPLVFIFYSSLTLYLVYKSIRRFSLNYKISWLIYISMPLFFMASLSTIRQSLSLAILLFSFRYIIEKKYIVFLFLVLLSGLFHFSGFLGILFWPIFSADFSKKSLWALYLFSFFGLFFVFFVSSLDFLQNYELTLRYYTFYVSAGLHKSTTLPFIYYGIQFVVLSFYDRLVKISAINKHYIAVTTFGIVIYNLFSFEQVTASRLSAFFLIFWILLLPSLVKLFNKREEILIDNFFVFFFTSIFCFYIYIYINAYENGVLEKISYLPYKTWLFK